MTCVQDRGSLVSDTLVTCNCRARLLTDLVRFEVPCLPLDEKDLRDDQCSDENQDHLGVHGLVTFVLLVQSLVLYPVRGPNGDQLMIHTHTCMYI